MNTETRLQILASRGWTVMPHLHSGTRPNGGSSVMVGATSEAESGRSNTNAFGTFAKGSVGGMSVDRSGRFAGRPSVETQTDDDEWIADSHYETRIDSRGFPILVVVETATAARDKYDSRGFVTMDRASFRRLIREISAYKLRKDGRINVVLNLPGLAPTATCNADNCAECARMIAVNNAKVSDQSRGVSVGESELSEISRERIRTSAEIHNSRMDAYRAQFANN